MTAGVAATQVVRTVAWAMLVVEEAAAVEVAGHLAASAVPKEAHVLAGKVAAMVE